ncbi:MAG: hypothetical protein L3J52_02270 [Proteobacteria bacterium]|nr:hypothetical protein [Pseudomonadota bacterium]
MGKTNGTGRPGRRINMKCLSVVQNHFSVEQFEMLHYRLLSLLNFDHHLDVVLMPGSIQKILSDKQISKNFHALALYGVDHFYLHQSTTPVEQNIIPLTRINTEQLNNLFPSADLIL